MSKLVLGLVGLLTLSVLACKHNDGDSVVVTGEGVRLSSEAIDRDPLALLPAQALAVGWLDAQAFLASPLGGETNRLAAKYIPLGEDAGFVPRRDLKRVITGVYSLAGADVVSVMQGDFSPEKIRLAADRKVAAGGSAIVHSTYAGNDVYTVGNVGFALVTTHTLLLGNQTGMRRALDRIRDNRLQREVPDWIVQLIEHPQASMVLAGDVTARPEMAAIAKSAAFLNGLSTFRILGNFQNPGLNLAGTLSYPNAAGAAAGADALRGAGQMVGALNLLAVFGVSSPLRKLDVVTQGNDAMFVAAIDAQLLAQLFSRAM